MPGQQSPMSFSTASVMVWKVGLTIRRAGRFPFPREILCGLPRRQIKHIADVFASQRRLDLNRAGTAWGSPRPLRARCPMSPVSPQREGDLTRTPRLAPKGWAIERNERTSGATRMAERGGFGLDTHFKIRPISNNSARSGTLTTRAIRTSLASNPRLASVFCAVHGRHRASLA